MKIIPESSGHYLDLKTWPRAAAFDFFKHYEMPFFDIATTVDVAPTLAFCKKNQISFFQATWFFVMAAAQKEEAFRYRIRDEGVWVWDEIFLGSTVALDDDAFGFCYFEQLSNFRDFSTSVSEAIAELKENPGVMGVYEDRDDLMHCTVLPWIHFTSISHARRLDASDSVPKIAIGKYEQGVDSTKMPISISLHHALADAVHVARFLESLQTMFMNPSDNLKKY